MDSQDRVEFKGHQEESSKNQQLESMEIIAGKIAHDFNNLLGGIYGYIELAAENTGKKAVQDHLARALAIIDRAKELTGQMLTFSKKNVPNKKIENLTLFIREKTLCILNESKLSCKFKLQENLWLCECDRKQIGLVLENLIINAQQSMPEGGSIEISAENADLSCGEQVDLAGGKCIKISVKDHGAGISKEIIPMIFEPFFTTKHKSLGLGLSISHSIVKRHGGCIDVESEIGKGSTFHIYLPALTGTSEIEISLS
jgi:two-component system cell cycle sensor histidine kinase/response regulator CckA